jgi:hypothetical protein
MCSECEVCRLADELKLTRADHAETELARQVAVSDHEQTLRQKVAGLEQRIENLQASHEAPRVQDVAKIHALEEQVKALAAESDSLHVMCDKEHAAWAEVKRRRDRLVTCISEAVALLEHREAPGNNVHVLGALAALRRA